MKCYLPIIKLKRMSNPATLANVKRNQFPKFRFMKLRLERSVLNHRRKINFRPRKLARKMEKPILAQKKLGYKIINATGVVKCITIGTWYNN